jgi:Cys-tRNA(Pro)/Cys-tRNA(Cys) deacylase
MSTRAIEFLKSRKIDFAVSRYDHKEKGAAFASEALGHLLECTIKTLVVGLGPRNFVLVLMPGHLNLSLKRLAEQFSTKRAAMVDVPTAERLTGYTVGGISPFAVKKNMPSVMDASLLKCEKVAINGGKRGTMLIVNPHDIVSLLKCKVMPLT